MKNQYQKEISQIHVPAELLEKTKLAMKEEERKLAKEEKKQDEGFKGKGKVVPFGRVSMVAAAAVLLLLVVPAASNLLKEEEPIQDMQMHLAGQQEIELVQISSDSDEEAEEKNWLEKIVDKIEEFFE